MRRQEAPKRRRKSCLDSDSLSRRYSNLVPEGSCTFFQTDRVYLDIVGVASTSVVQHEGSSQVSPAVNNLDIDSGIGFLQSVIH